MASLVLENVTVDFPIYGAQKSFRSALRTATGGLIRREGPHQDRIIVRAIDNLSLTLEHGDRLGIIGPNGAGKSTLLQVCAGVYSPSSGRVTIEGKVSPLFNASPGIDPDDTGYENILTCGLFLGIPRDEIERKSPDIEEFCELGEYLNLPVRTYSTGMLTRLAFAIATAVDPGILLLDEGLGSGDARFAEKARRRIDALIESSSILILASHSDELIQSLCNIAILMRSGHVELTGSVEDVIDAYHRSNQPAS